MSRPFPPPLLSPSLLQVFNNEDHALNLYGDNVEVNKGGKGGGEGPGAFE